MNRTRALLPIVFTLSVTFILSCTSGSSSKDGIEYSPAEIKKILETNELDQKLAMDAVNFLKKVEVYTAENFEQKQKDAMKLLTPNFRKQAEEYLPKRVKMMKDNNYSQTFEPKMEDIVLQKMPYGDIVRARVKVPAIRVVTKDGEYIPKRDGEFGVTMLVYGIGNYRVQRWTIK